MSATVRIDGLDRLTAALRNLPRELAAEAQDIVQEAARGAATAIAAAYPTRSGTLRTRLRLRTRATGPFGTAVTLSNTSPHAVLFEYGTRARHTAIGAFRGVMPAGHVFVPRAIRFREAMLRRLQALVDRKGSEAMRRG